MKFGEQTLPLGSEKLGIAPGRLELDPVARQAWWLAELQPQPPGTMLLYLVQRAGDGLGRVVPAFVRAPLPDASGKFISLCLAWEIPPTVKLGDFSFMQVVHWQVRSDLTARTASQ